MRWLIVALIVVAGCSDAQQSISDPVPGSSVEQIQGTEANSVYDYVVLEGPSQITAAGAYSWTASTSMGRSCWEWLKKPSGGSWQTIAHIPATEIAGLSLSFDADEPDFELKARATKEVFTGYCSASYFAMDTKAVSVDIYTPPSSPTLSVSISGPSTIQVSATCTWEASASGGNGTYTYSWYNDNQYVGSGSTYSGGRLSGSTSNTFTLSVVAQASNGYGSASLTVTEDQNADICMI